MVKWRRMPTIWVKEDKKRVCEGSGWVEQEYTGALAQSILLVYARAGLTKYNSFFLL
jgi:hypothetical protein